MKFPRMKTALAVVALCAASQAGAAVPGFAGNVTGGGTATPVVVNTLAAAQAAVNSYSGSGGLVLRYTGTFDETAILNNICAQWSKPIQELSISGKNDITVLGADGSSANFGIRIKGTSGNIIVRNMKMGLLPGGASNGDIIGIESSAHNVWIDHNELYSRNIACPGTPDNDTTFDGALDIKNSATNITVSYNFIHDHSKVGLDGSSDSDSAERRITYAHNRYENVGSRLPLQRFGLVHVYNNYYNGITSSGINVRMTGHALIENNWFENAVNAVTSRSSPTLGDWDLRNNNARSAADNARFNLTWNSGSAPFRNADTWTTTAAFPIALPYTYTTYPPDVSRCIAINAAGVGKGLREAPDVLTLCGQASSLAVAPTAITFSGAAQSAQVAVTSNVSWTVAAAGFVTVSPAFGTGNGTFTVSVTGNAVATRVATITVSGGGISRAIQITQTADSGPTPTLNVSPASFALPAGASQSVLTVSSTVAWMVSSSQPWLTFTPNTGGSAGGLQTTVSVIMRAEANPTTSPRTATVTFTGGGLSRTVIVTQAGQAPTTGAVAATPVVTSSGPWFTEEQVRLTNTAPITALTLTITVQRTAGVNPGNAFNTVGSGITQAISSTATTISYTFTLNAGQTLFPGIERTFAAQSLGSGTAHPTSGDSFIATGTAGGQPFTLNGTF